MHRFIVLAVVLLAAFLLLPWVSSNRKRLGFSYNVLVIALLVYIAYNIYYVFSRY